MKIKNKVTPKTLKVLKELGLFNTDIEASNIVLSLLSEEENLKKFCDAVFDFDGEVDYMNLDIIEVVKGYQSFLAQLSPKTAE